MSWIPFGIVVAFMMVLAVIAVVWLDLLIPSEEAQQFAKENPELVYGDFFGLLPK